MELTRRAFTKATAFLSLIGNAEQLSISEVHERMDRRREKTSPEQLDDDAIREIVEEVIWSIQRDDLASAQSTVTDELSGALASREWGSESDLVVGSYRHVESYDDYGRVGIGRYPGQSEPMVAVDITSGHWGKAGFTLSPGQARQLSRELEVAADDVEERHEEWRQSG